MASSIRKFSTLFLFICLAFLLISTWEVQLAEAQGCKRKSKTFRGPCLHTNDCNNECITEEHAHFGDCDFHSGFSCFCHFC
ncbi:defensin-like protein 19 [Gastrolobium bilobum]|uniref:defensin-like protein 19 n=1 Tax=Gastrolobium bilobum TaxID=150636 RepID=UPI002AAF8C2E|nr:defensin-like protein 19 [Gastrolobium bilobum]